jgi:hypothetical protein
MRLPAVDCMFFVNPDNGMEKIRDASIKFYGQLDLFNEIVCTMRFLDKALRTAGFLREILWTSFKPVAPIAQLPAPSSSFKLWALIFQ